MLLPEFLQILKLPMEEMKGSAWKGFSLMNWKYYPIITYVEGPLGMDRLTRTAQRFSLIDILHNKLEQSLISIDLDEFYNNLAGIDVNLRTIEYALGHMYYSLNDFRESQIDSKQKEEFEADIVQIENGLLSFENLTLFISDLIFSQPWFNKMSTLKATKVLSQNVKDIIDKYPHLPQISSLSELSWQEFEDVCGTFFNSLGFEVFQTIPSKDGDSIYYC